MRRAQFIAIILENRENAPNPSAFGSHDLGAVTNGKLAPPDVAVLLALLAHVSIGKR
jgi:hypothetical protein